MGERWIAIITAASGGVDPGPVEHTFGPEKLTAAGRDTETMALARAVKRHTEHRVFLDGNKTVVFK